MPILKDNDMQTYAKGTNFGFSAKRIDSLGASEYTLVVIAADTSGSVSGFRGQIEKCVKEIVRSCQRSPRADNLMLRLVTFDSDVDEFHGFRPLTDCDEAGYTGCITTGGCTALHDATHDAVESATTYGKDLTDHDFDVNAIVFVVTDGADNSSRHGLASVKKAMKRAVTSEALESLVSVLVGVDVGDASLSSYLTKFRDGVGFTQYVEVARANAKTLARLADFVSRSISAQSQALGSGAATPALTF